MADLADNAQVLEEMERDAAIARHRRMSHSEAETADNCTECGLQIPSQRQAALPGVQTCVGCAEALEKKAMHYKRTY
jgi:phage/conjugal plasmid C-4 type zinc finger TraR family protein